MIRKFLIILLALCAVVAAQGKPTIAVYPQKGDLGQKQLAVLCTKILNVLQETERFQQVERSDNFLAAINKEIENQRSNNPDDQNIAKFGERLGAEFVCAVVATDPFDNNEYQVDARITDLRTNIIVLTGEATGKINGMDDLQKMADAIVKDMFKKASRQKLDEIFSERKSVKSESSGSGGSGQSTNMPADKRSGQSAGTPADKRVESSTGTPTDKRSEQSTGTSVDKRVEPSTSTPADKRGEASVVKDEKLDIDMVLVRGGTFKMGCTAEQSNCSGDEKPVRNVTLGDFNIGKYQVTQKLWFQVMGNNPSKFKGDNFPVENVSYDMVQEFIEKLNAKTGKRYRLPTEAEWEYAARGGNKSKGYIYSGGNYIDDVAWHNGNSQGKTHAVGGKEPNELGVYDMSGNVWEWVNDWKGTYSSSDETNPKGPNKGFFDGYRIPRGGSWNYNAKNCRVSKREDAPPDYKAPHVGFRLARSAQ